MSRHLFPRSLALPLVAGVAAIMTAAAPAVAVNVDPSQAELAATLDAILNSSSLSGANVSVVVANADTGEVLFDRNGNNRLIPASNTKLLTSTAAMSILGPDYRFNTSVSRTGRKAGSVLLGDLFVRGTGDPTMLAEDYDNLAAQVAASGIKVVTGSLVADDTWFDDQRLGMDWAWDDEGAYYAAEISALTLSGDTDYDAGNVIVEGSPGATVGAKPAVSLTPQTGYVKIINNGITAEAGATDTLSISREHDTNNIVINGQVPVDGGSTTEWIAVRQPTGYAADVFRRALQARGVKVLGQTKLGVATPTGATGIASHDSMTLSDLLVPFLKLSNNGHAEILTKAIGRKVFNDGSWDAGLEAIANYVAGRDMDTSTQRQADGSGLSRWNLITTHEFTDLLRAVQAEPWFDTWYAALPIAGNADRFTGGTLRSRMRNTPAANNLHGKTGSLTSVSALSGYVTAANGTKLVFSIVENNYLVSSVRGIEDQIGVALASWGASSVAGRSIAPPADSANGRADIECSWVKPNTC